MFHSETRFNNAILMHLVLFASQRGQFFSMYRFVLVPILVWLHGNLINFLSRTVFLLKGNLQ